MAEEEVNPEDLEIADELIAERRAEAPGETPEDMTPWQRPITAVIDVINYRGRSGYCPAHGTVDCRSGARSPFPKLVRDLAKCRVRRSCPYPWTWSHALGV